MPPFQRTHIVILMLALCVVREAPRHGVGAGQLCPMGVTAVGGLQGSTVGRISAELQLET